MSRVFDSARQADLPLAQGLAEPDRALAPPRLGCGGQVRRCRARDWELTSPVQEHALLEIIDTRRPWHISWSTLRACSGPSTSQSRARRVFRQMVRSRSSGCELACSPRRPLERCARRVEDSRVAWRRPCAAERVGQSQTQRPSCSAGPGQLPSLADAARTRRALAAATRRGWARRGAERTRRPRRVWRA